MNILSGEGGKKERRGKEEKKRKEEKLNFSLFPIFFFLFLGESSSVTLLASSIVSAVRSISNYFMEEIRRSLLV